MKNTDSEEKKREEEIDEEKISEHLNNISDGIGCTEIWEYLSKKKNEEDEN